MLGKGVVRVRAKTTRKGELVPSYYLVPWLLVAMSVGTLALISWGGFIEERRNGRSRS
jgi:hypothetical protein